MTIGLKDIVYLVAYFATIISLYYGFKHRLSNVEREVRRGMKVLYQDAGKLNLIDCDTCKKHRDEIFTALRRSEKSVEMLLLELRDIKENMIIIMVHMGIKTPNGIKKK